MLATNPIDKEILDRAISIIEKNLDNTEFNVNIFAREMAMARTNLFTKLKAITGQTPNDFILTIRLKRRLDVAEQPGTKHYRDIGQNRFQFFTLLLKVFQGRIPDQSAGIP